MKAILVLKGWWRTS
ncbi:trp operon leader peptide [Escherichia coli]|nr:trp operon leader peptide [Escherichia coli]MDO2690292.1 trp operon leader peptide [Escherichia coli]